MGKLICLESVKCTLSATLLIPSRPERGPLHCSKVNIVGDNSGYNRAPTGCSASIGTPFQYSGSKILKCINGSSEFQNQYARWTVGSAPDRGGRRDQGLSQARFEKLTVRYLVDEAMSSIEESSNGQDGMNESTDEEHLIPKQGRDHSHLENANLPQTEKGEQHADSSSSSDVESASLEFVPELASMEESLGILEDTRLWYSLRRNWSKADVQRMDVLRKYEYRVQTGGGDLVIQGLRVEHTNDVEELLVDSFAELMGGLLTYRPLLRLTVRQYIRERFNYLPDAVTLVGLYSPAEKHEFQEDYHGSEARNWELVGTVELSFSNAGHPDIPGGPSPPTSSPYLCNMAVNPSYRRRGIGKHMLKAAESLAESEGCEDMYLHCRIIDAAPLNMYKTAGYEIVGTDSLLSLLSFQRRRYLMMKRFSQTHTSSEKMQGNTIK